MCLLMFNVECSTFNQQTKQTHLIHQSLQTVAALVALTFNPPMLKYLNKEPRGDILSIHRKFVGLRNIGLPGIIQTTLIEHFLMNFQEETLLKEFHTSIVLFLIQFHAVHVDCSLMPFLSLTTIFTDLADVQGRSLLDCSNDKEHLQLAP